MASPIAVASFLLPRGDAAMALASVWLVATIVIAITGALRIARRGTSPIEELSIDVGHLYLPVGGAWLIAARGGLEPLGFREPVVTFTANHFHYAGFAAPVIVGLLGRQLALRRRPGQTDAVASKLVRSTYLVAAPIVIVGIPLVAAGITISRSLEMPAAILLGIGMLLVSMLLARTGAQRLLERGVLVKLTGVGLLVAATSLVLSMAFAVAFTTTGSAGRDALEPVIPFKTMVQFHGAANAYGFALAALLAFAIVPALPRVRVARVLWPRLRAKGFVGVDWFDREGIIDPSRGVTGQVESLDALGHASFHPDRVHPEVRRFYEHSAAFDLVVDPTWHAPFRIGGRAFARFARRFLGQLELPTARGQDDVVTTRLFAVREGSDGRPNANGYVRAYGEGAEARANYVASYAVVDVGGVPHLAPAFPLPRCAMVGVLRFDDGPEAGSLVVSSAPRQGEGTAGEGIYLVTALGAVRLPVSETIEVRADGGALRALHQFRVLGLRAFTLRYELRDRR